MNSRLRAALEQYIQKWCDDHCEDDDWPDVIVGDQTVALMAQSAANVFDACEESQQYAKREGYSR